MKNRDIALDITILVISVIVIIAIARAILS